MAEMHNQSNITGDEHMTMTTGEKNQVEQEVAEENDTSVAPKLLEPAAHLAPGTNAPATGTITPSGKSNMSDSASAEKAVEPIEEQKPRRPQGIVWVLVVLSILSSTFLFALDNTIVADIQPAIVERFGSISKLPWLSVAFLVAAAATNLVWGKMYAQFDAKILYLLCVFLFELGSAVCGAAPNINALIIGRAICGWGGAGMYTGVMTLLAVTTTEHERPTYIGFTGLTWGAGTVLGEFSNCMQLLPDRPVKFPWLISLRSNHWWRVY